MVGIGGFLIRKSAILPGTRRATYMDAAGYATVIHPPCLDFQSIDGVRAEG